MLVAVSFHSECIDSYVLAALHCTTRSARNKQLFWKLFWSLSYLSFQSAKSTMEIRNTLRVYMLCYGCVSVCVRTGLCSIGIYVVEKNGDFVFSLLNLICPVRTIAIVVVRRLNELCAQQFT